MSPEKEAARYAAVNAQVKEQLDAGVNDRSPMVAMMRALLSAELYVCNEQTHRHATEETAQEQGEQ